MSQQHLTRTKHGTLVNGQSRAGGVYLKKLLGSTGGLPEAAMRHTKLVTQANHSKVDKIMHEQYRNSHVPHTYSQPSLLDIGLRLCDLLEHIDKIDDNLTEMQLRRDSTVDLGTKVSCIFENPQTTGKARHQVKVPKSFCQQNAHLCRLLPRLRPLGGASTVC